MNYMRLMTHLQYFIQRVQTDKIYDESDLVLNTQIKMLYTDAYDCIQKIKVYIQEKYECVISIDEETYLMLHIHRVTNRSKKES